MTKIIIETDDVTGLVREGGKFVFKQEAERAIYDLLMLKEMIEKHIDEIKSQIAQAGQSIDPNFKGIIGETINAVYRYYGERYSYDPNYRETLYSAGFLKENVSYKVDSAAVDEHFKKTSELPTGITVKERNKVISFSKKDEPKNALVVHPSPPLDAGSNG